MDNRKLTRKSSCRQSSEDLSTVLETTLKLWNRTAVSKQLGGTSVQTYTSSRTIPLCSLLGCGCRLASSSFQLLPELIQGPPFPMYPQAASNLATVTAAVRSQTPRDRSWNHKNQQWRSQQVWFEPRSQTSCVFDATLASEASTLRPNCSRIEDCWHGNGPSLAPS